MGVASRRYGTRSGSVRTERFGLENAGMSRTVSSPLRRIGGRTLVALLLLWLGLASVMLEAAGFVPRLDTLLLLAVLSAALICGGVVAHTCLRPAKALPLLMLLGQAVTALTLSELWSRLVA